MIDLWPLQRAIYAALTLPPPLFPVFDAVPQGTPYPYIGIGDWTAEADEELAVPSIDAYLRLEAWSRYAGKQEALEMLEFIRGRLDAQALPGIWAITEDFAEVLEDRESTDAARLFHGVARYRVRATLEAIAPPLEDGPRLAAHLAFAGAATLSETGDPIGYFVDHPAFPGFVTPDGAAAPAEADATPVLGVDGFVTLEAMP